MDNNENRKRTDNQRTRILRWMLEHPDKGLTHLTALQMFGCIELPKRVSELVQNGHPVKRDRTITNEYGVRFKEYYITAADAMHYSVPSL